MICSRAERISLLSSTIHTEMIITQRSDISGSKKYHFVVVFCGDWGWWGVGLGQGNVEQEFLPEVLAWEQLMDLHHPGAAATGGNFFVKVAAFEADEAVGGGEGLRDRGSGAIGGCGGLVGAALF